METSYKEIFYKKYASTHTVHRKGAETAATLKGRIPAWNANFGRFLDLQPDARIIDIGCGTGSLVWWLQHRGFSQAQGIDISEEQVRIAASLGVKNVQQADLQQYMTERPGHFDMIILRDVMEHFPKELIINVFEICQLALKPGGKIVIQVPNAESPFFGRIRYGDFTHDIAFCSSSLSQLFNVFGFTDFSYYQTRRPVTGIRSFLRQCLWKCVESCYRVALYAELGSGNRIVTQDIIGVAAKRP